MVQLIEPGNLGITQKKYFDDYVIIQDVKAANLKSI
jgi:hypothetical protein